MKTRMQLGILVLSILFGSMVGAAELNTALILTTPLPVCGEWHPSGWTNDGPPMRIKSTSIWFSGASGTPFIGALQRWDGMIIQYAGSGSASQSFGDDWMTLHTGDSLYFWAYCGSPGINGWAGVALTYTSNR